jgi:DNA-binding IclR family transcriptional regulator
VHPSQHRLLTRMNHLADGQRTVSLVDLCDDLAISQRSMVNRLVRLTAYGVVEPRHLGDDSSWRLTNRRDV